MFRKNNLKFTFKYLSDYQREEARLLMDYVDYFGELPPLNNQDVEKNDEKLFHKKYPKEFKW